MKMLRHIKLSGKNSLIRWLVCRVLQKVGNSVKWLSEVSLSYRQQGVECRGSEVKVCCLLEAGQGGQCGCSTVDRAAC